MAWLVGLVDGRGLLIQGVLVFTAILGAAFMAEVAVGWALGRLRGPNPEADGSQPRAGAQKWRYLAIMQVFARVLIWTSAVVAMLEVWNFGALGWTVVDHRWMHLALVRILLFALVVLVIVALLERAMVRALANGTRGATTQRRVATLLMLGSSALRVIAVALVALVALSELGVNIGPVLAGAGVVGIAVGFGAQKLVQDVISGLFILIEGGSGCGR